jgi:hypothetical protein
VGLVDGGGVGGTAAGSGRREKAEGVYLRPGAKTDGVGVDEISGWVVGEDGASVSGCCTGGVADRAFGFGFRWIGGTGGMGSVAAPADWIEHVSWVELVSMSSSVSPQGCFIAFPVIALAASLASRLLFMSSKDDVKKPDLGGADVPEPTSSRASSQPFRNLRAAPY